MDVKNASSMETFKKKCTCNHPLAIHIQAVKFVAFAVLFMASSRLLELAKYASDLLSKAGITDNKTVSTPLEYNAKLTPLDGEPISDATRYRQLVGSLIYLTVTRPDISHAVGMGTLYHGLHYSSRSSLELHAYSDADWAGDPTDRCSITGFCFLLGTSLVSWRSKKQDVVSRSSTEAEYRALADTTCELVWLRWLLADMDAPQPTATPLNKSIIRILIN
ncbi:uncharacterized mitochondrial protein AtMg00810-like [Quercus suber]|uniref:uncharacterized mitochondrial protein AtMg00810-like n=1 Tax=Quercus suber TaxID=58331 RepID=UPI0032DEFE35